MTIDNNANLNANAAIQNDGEIATETGGEAPSLDVDSGSEEPMSNDEVRTAATSSENFTIPASAVVPAPASVKCECFPHGTYAILPALFATVAWFA